MPRLSRASLRSAWTKTLRILRRSHMYAGLFLVPWLLFFGLSGVLFNHPNVGEEVNGQRLGPDSLKDRGIEAWQTDTVARELVEELNARDPARAYSLDPDFAPRFTGGVILKARGPEGQHMVFLDLARGAGVLVHRKARPSAVDAPFVGATAELEGRSLEAIEEKLAGLLRERGLEAQGPLRVTQELAPELEFRMKDANGVSYNVTYDTGSHRVDGRPTDAFPAIGMSQLFAKLHTTHHFPNKFGARWLWALFEDLLGLTMVFWAVSGLVMWWQIQPSRVVGVVTISLALGLAALVLYGTASELFFGNVPQVLGPGED